MNKNYVVSWSGGFDSTFLLLRTINSMTDKDTITIISLNNEACGTKKNFRENNARKILKENLIKIYSGVINDKNFTTIKINYGKGKFNCGFTPNNNIGFAQPILWMFSIIPFIKTDADVLFGYCKYDKIFDYYGELKTIFDASSRLANKRLNFEAPLRGFDKTEIIKKIYDITDDDSIIKLCTTCENFNDNDDNCSSCNSCKDLIYTFTTLQFDSQEKYRILGKNNLMERFGIKIDIKRQNKF